MISQECATELLAVLKRARPGLEELHAPREGGAIGCPDCRADPDPFACDLLDRIDRAIRKAEGP